MKQMFGMIVFDRLRACVWPWRNTALPLTVCMFMVTSVLSVFMDPRAAKAQDCCAGRTVQSAGLPAEKGT